MQSLRSRRPSESRPVKRNASKLAKSPSTRRKSTVDDKMKKRMSLRYADISAPTDPSVPALPTIPLGLRPGAHRDPDEIVKDVAHVKEDPRLLDQRLLDKEDFDPDDCASCLHPPQSSHSPSLDLKAKLANSTEAELKSLQSSLRSLKDDTAVDLQRNVFKKSVHPSPLTPADPDDVAMPNSYSYQRRLASSRTRCSNSRKVSRNGRTCLPSSTLTNPPPSLVCLSLPLPFTSDPLPERRRAARSSVVDLRILYASQMQTLHSQISGSAKFAPATPGRHVVAEMDGIWELNAATYKVISMVRFVILDDAVLVARRRRGGAPTTGTTNAAETAGKLVAERCWPLNEMLVLDTKDTASTSSLLVVASSDPP